MLQFVFRVDVNCEFICLLFDGIKSQVHGFIEVVIKEYRSDRELFNLINLEL